MTIEAKVSKGASIEDGKHTGKILRFEERTTPQGYKYLDCILQVDGFESEMKVGNPLSLGPSTKLGQFLQILGVDVGEIIANAKGETVDVEGIVKRFEGRKVSFMTLKKDPNGYANVIPNSVRIMK